MFEPCRASIATLYRKYFGTRQNIFIKTSHKQCAYPKGFLDRLGMTVETMGFFTFVRNDTETIHVETTRLTVILSAALAQPKNLTV